MKDLTGPTLRAALPAGYMITNRGIGVIVDEEDMTEWLCSEIKVVGRCHRVDGTGWGRLTEFRDPEGVKHTAYVPDALSPSLVAKELKNRGLGVNRSLKGAERLLAALLSEWETSETFVLVDRMGWVDTSCKTYVLSPHQVIGSQKVHVLGDVADSADRRVAGSLADWQSHVASKCVGNAILTCAVSAAFAAPLAQLLNVDSFTLHLRGHSSSGKTTALRVANSVWNSPAGMQTWRTTSNALETIASSASDSLLALDELGQVSAQAAEEASYMVGNGKGKHRARSGGGLAANASWRLIALSTGEISLTEKVSEAGKKTKAGQEARFVDIEADGRAYGVFDNIHNAQDGAAFSTDLSKAATQFYGEPGAAFVEHLLGLSAEGRAALGPMLDKMESLIVGSAARPLDGPARRVARSLALVALGGELARSAKITGWQERAALSAVCQIFANWQEEKQRPAQVVIDRVIDWLNGNAGRFSDLASETNSDGYGYKDDQHVYLSREAWDRVFPREQSEAALRTLDEQRILLRDGSHYAVKMPRWVPARERHYKISASKLAEFGLGRDESGNGE